MRQNGDDNESTMTAGQMTGPNALSSGGDDDFEDDASDDGLRSTAKNNLIIMLNGEMVFGKKDGDHPRPRPNVLRGGIMPRRPMVTSPAMVSPAGIREANGSMRNMPADSDRGSVTDSQLFDQSTLDEDDISYNHRPISPIGDASVGSMQQIAREIDLMEGSYFSTREQPLLPREVPAPGRSGLSAHGMARIQDISSDDDDDEDDYAIAQYPLSTPYRSIQLKDDWVKAWGQAWGLQVNKAEEQKRRNRINALTVKREVSRYTAGTLKILSPSTKSSSPYVKPRYGPSVTAVMDKSISKAAGELTGSPLPPGPNSPAKSPWADRTMEWAASEPTRTPAKAAAVDLSTASAEKTVKKSKWVFGDDEQSEDEDDDKLGEDNIDGEEPWTRSAKKQNRAFEPYRKMPVLGMTSEDIEKASAAAQRKHTNPYSIRKHAISSREQQVQSDEDIGPAHEQESILKYTPDIAKLRLNREKLRRGEYDDEEDYRPLFRRNDGRLVRKLNPIATSLSESIAQPKIVNLCPNDRVGAWV